MNIIIINGNPRCGKDTFVELCNKHLYWCLNTSTVDFVKEVAKFCGWDGTKDAKNRAFLSDLKDLLTEWDDVPFKKVEKAVHCFVKSVESYDFTSGEAIAFVHCREPKEIAKLVDKLGAKTLLIRRAAVEGGEQSNHADAEVFNYEYDYTIDNNGTIEEFEQKAIDFLKELGYKDLINVK